MEHHPQCILPRKHEGTCMLSADCKALGLSVDQARRLFEKLPKGKIRTRHFGRAAV